MFSTKIVRFSGGTGAPEDVDRVYNIAVTKLSACLGLIKKYARNSKI